MIVLQVFTMIVIWILTCFISCFIGNSYKKNNNVVIKVKGESEKLTTEEVLRAEITKKEYENFLNFDGTPQDEIDI